MGRNLDPNISRHRPFRIWSNLCIHGCRDRSSGHWRSSSSSFCKYLLSFNSPPYFMLTFFSFSAHLLLKIFSMIYLLFPLLWKLIFAMSSIVISAPTRSMSPTRLVGGTRNGLFILVSIAWHWIIWLFQVSVFLLFFMFFIINNNYIY